MAGIINAIAGGIGDGMQTYAGILAQEYAAREREEERRRSNQELDAARLERTKIEERGRDERSKEDRDARYRLEMEKLAAKKEELLLRLQEAKEKNRSAFESRPDLYGHTKLPGKEEFTENMPTRVDDSEYSDAVSRKQAPLVDREVYDKKGHAAAVDAAAQTNIDRKTQVDAPQHYDDQQKGRGRGIVNSILERDPSSTDAAAAALAVEGKNRFDVQGNTVVDHGKGAARSTEVGESIEDKNRRPPIGRASGASSTESLDARKDVDSLTRDVTNARNNVTNIMKAGVYSDAQRKELASSKSRLQALEDKLESARERLRKADAVKPPPAERPVTSAAAPSSTQSGAGNGKGFDHARAIADAKLVLARRPDQRDEVLRRLRSAGIDTRGL